VKNYQRWIIIAILLLPIAIGLILLFTQGTESEAAVTSSIKKIGLVKVEGAISESYSVVNQLKSFLSDKSIAGVLLRVDSPGGSVAPSQEIYDEVLKYKLQKKPLIVSMGNLAASGGYYISSPAQKIFANPGTVTGSIGVIFTSPLFEDLTKKIGVEFRVYKAGKYKDIGSPYRKMSDEENGIIKNLLDDTHLQFIEDVAKGRGISKDSIAAIADGRIFTGRQALKQKLVDTLGGYEDAVTYIKMITGLPAKSKLVERKEKSMIFKEWLTEEASRIFPQLYSFLSKTGPQYLFWTGN
jgi:protease-4